MKLSTRPRDKPAVLRPQVRRSRGDGRWRQCHCREMRKGDHQAGQQVTFWMSVPENCQFLECRRDGARNPRCLVVIDPDHRTEHGGPGDSRGFPNGDDGRPCCGTGAPRASFHSEPAAMMAWVTGSDACRSGRGGGLISVISPYFHFPDQAPHTATSATARSGSRSGRHRR